MKMRLEMREVHQDSIESVLGQLLSRTGREEVMKVVGEEVVELFGRRRVLVLVGTPREKLLNCVIVSREGAGGIGCLDEDASGLRRRHGEMGGQQD
jgi:hypothetical protein